MKMVASATKYDGLTLSWLRKNILQLLIACVLASDVQEWTDRFTNLLEMVAGGY